MLITMSTYVNNEMWVKLRRYREWVNLFEEAHRG
jgi:hypothetical protein